MNTINEELRLFVRDVTLFLQKHTNYNPEKIEPMFQRAYKLYVKYNVENQQGDSADGATECHCESPAWPLDPCVNCGGMPPLI